MMVILNPIVSLFQIRLARQYPLCFRFNGVPAEERLHWRTFLVKLGTENLKNAKNEELFVASHKYDAYSDLLSNCVCVVCFLSVYRSMLFHYITINYS